MKVKVVVGEREEVLEGLPKEIILEMSRRDFIAQGKGEYMEEVKNRLHYMYNKDINFKGPKFGIYRRFLEELARVEMIEILPDE